MRHIIALLLTALVFAPTAALGVSRGSMVEQVDDLPDLDLSRCYRDDNTFWAGTGGKGDGCLLVGSSPEQYYTDCDPFQTALGSDGCYGDWDADTGTGRGQGTNTDGWGHNGTLPVEPVKGQTSRLEMYFTFLTTITPELDRNGDVQGGGAIKFLRFVVFAADGQTGLYQVDLYFNGIHPDQPANSDFYLTVENWNSEGSYREFLPNTAEQAVGTEHRYALEVAWDDYAKDTVDPSTGRYGTASMKLYIDGVLVGETPDDFETLREPTHRVLGARFLSYYNGPRTEKVAALFREVPGVDPVVITTTPAGEAVAGADLIPLDLSPINADLALAFDCDDVSPADGFCDDNTDLMVIPQPPPATLPNLTNPDCLASTASELRACMALSGRRYLLSDGVYDDGGSWGFNQDDVMVEAVNPGGVTLMGLMSVSGGAERVHIKGIRSDSDQGGTGNGNLLFTNYRDVTIENNDFDWRQSGGQGVFCQSTGADPCERMTFVGNRIRSNRSSVFVQRDTSGTNSSEGWIFHKNIFSSDYNGAGTTGTNEQAMRLMTVTGATVWQNYFEHSATTPKGLIRLHQNTQGVLIKSNVFCNRDEDQTYGIWLRPESTNGSTTEGPVAGVWILDNEFYDLDTTPTPAAPVDLDDNGAGAPTVRDVFTGGNTYYSSDNRVFDARVVGNVPAGDTLLYPNFAQPLTACPSTDGYGPDFL